LFPALSPRERAGVRMGGASPHEKGDAMNMRTEIRDGKGVVTVTGPLNAAVVDTFREQIQKWMSENEEVRQIVLDAGDLDYIDSAGLGVLIALLKRTTERGGDIRIARLRNKARIV
jgi:anti-sigma B factor antagonist